MVAAGPLAYSAAKSAVVNLTLHSAVELAPHHIRVNAICPGLIFTPLAIGRNEAALRERMPTFQPWPDGGEPDDIAGVALWLAGPDSGFVTGEAIRVDGGLLAAGPRMFGMVDPHGAPALRRVHRRHHRPPAGEAAPRPTRRLSVHAARRGPGLARSARGRPARRRGG